jgi:hypothetical protein
MASGTLDDATRDALAAVLRVLDDPRARVAVTAEAFARLGARRRSDLEALVPLLHETLATLPAGVDGTGVVVAEGLLEDAPLHLEWWRRSGRLEVTYDPEDPASFDYPQAEWFAVPRDRGVPWIAGPFVDSGGTNRHLCTYSVPVHDREGRFLGIAGADLRVGHVERVARKALAAVGAPAALVNREGRVIAATEPGVAAGTLLEGAGPPGRGTWEPALPWGVALL